MKNKWRLLIAVCVCLSFMTVPVVARAAYPDKPVLAIVPFSPGGGNDILIRLIAKHITPFLGQSIAVENKPGAGGQIGWTALSKARADGYTISVTSLPSMILIKLLRENVPFNLDDFRYVCNVQVDPLIWAVTKDSQFKSAADIVAYAKANPGKLNVAGDGPKSNVQLQELVVEKALDIKTNFIPYNGSGPSATALLGNKVDFAILTLSSAVSHIESGRLVPLVVFNNETVPGIDVKTSKDVFDLDIPSVGRSLRGIAVPKNVPEDVLKKLEAAFKSVTESPEFLEQAKALGLIINFMGNEDAEKAIAESVKTIEEYKDLF